MMILGRRSTILLFLWLGSFVIAQQEIYTVQKGDTLGKIAQDKLQDARLWVQLAKYNSIPNPNLIKTRQRIVIPTKAQLLLKGKEQESLQARVKVVERQLAQLRIFRHQLLLEDNFESYQLDKQPTDWLFPSSGRWRISPLGSRVLEQADRKASNSAALVGQESWSNYIVQVELRIEHSGDAGVFAYWNSHTENYRLRTSNKHNRIQIVKRVPRDRSRYVTITLNEAPLTLEDRQWWIFRLEITTHHSYVYLKGKVWKKGETEPGSWLLEASDHSSERYESGQAGVWTINAGASYRGAKFDNFKILSLKDH